MNSRARPDLERHIVWPSHFHNGSHLSSALSTALVSLPSPVFPSPSSLQSRGALNSPFRRHLRDRSHPFPFRARNLELPLASRIALLFVSPTLDSDRRLFSLCPWLKLCSKGHGGPLIVRHTRVCDCTFKCRRDINPLRVPKLPAWDYKGDGNTL